jgi:hypothetical protein
MVVTTTLLCSKFSPKSIEAIDTLKRHNLESSVKIVWVDHPNVRQAVLNSNQIKSVPAMVVHDEERDFTMVYEKEQFAEYLTALVQNRPASRAMALQQSHNQVLQHQQAMNQQFQVAKAELNNHMLNNLNPTAIQERTNQAKDAINRQMFGPNGFQPIDEQKYNQQIQNQVNQMRNEIYSTVDQQKQLHQADYQNRMQQLKKTQEEDRRVSQQLYEEQQRQFRDRDERMAYEARQTRKLSMLPHLRQNPINQGLSEQQLLELAEDEIVEQELASVNAQLDQTRLLAKVRQDQPHMTLSDNTSSTISTLESKRSVLLTQKNNMAASLRRSQAIQEQNKNGIQQNLISVANQHGDELATARKQLLELEDRIYQQGLSDAERRSLDQQIQSKRASIHSLEKTHLSHATQFEQNKFKLSGTVSRLNHSVNDDGTTSLASLGIAPPQTYTTVGQTTVTDTIVSPSTVTPLTIPENMINPVNFTKPSVSTFVPHDMTTPSPYIPHDIPKPPSVTKTYPGSTSINDLLKRDQIDRPEEVVTTESMAGRLQREKFSNQVELYKTQEKFNNPEGVTRLDTTQDMSLFDIQQQLQRPSGTDLRQSESQIEAAMTSSKRNLANQKVREIYNRDPVIVPRSMMGVGHENLPNSSLARVPIQAVEENTSIDSLGTFEPIDFEHLPNHRKGVTSLNSNNMGAFSNTVNMKNDQIDGFGDERAAPATSKKKSKVSDLVKEMERERNAMVKEIDRERNGMS